MAPNGKLEIILLWILRITDDNKRKSTDYMWRYFTPTNTINDSHVISKSSQNPLPLIVAQTRYAVLIPPKNVSAVSSKHDKSSIFAMDVTYLLSIFYVIRGINYANYWHRSQYWLFYLIQWNNIHRRSKFYVDIHPFRELTHLVKNCTCLSLAVIKIELFLFHSLACTFIRW